MKYLYYTEGDSVKRLEIDDIDYIYMTCANKMDGFAEYIVYDVYAYTIESEFHKIYSSSKTVCMNYMKKFEQLDFMQTNKGEKYYNRKHVAIYNAIKNSKEPFFTDRDEYIILSDSWVASGEKDGTSS